MLYGKDKKMKEQNHPNVIKIRNAHVHNLKHIDVDIPLNKIVGIAGVPASADDRPPIHFHRSSGRPPDIHWHTARS